MNPGFRDLDAEPLAPYLVDYLLAVERRPDVVRMHALASTLSAPPPGGSALDAGCGVGGAALCLGRAVGPLGTVIGLDISEAVLAVARERASGPVRFQQGDVRDVPFPDDEFDLVRCERVLQHIPDAQRAVHELVRVCRPQGRVLLLDTDWGSLACDGVDPDLAGEVLGAVWRVVAHPRSGVQLRGRLLQAGCQDVHAVPCVFSMTTVADAAGLVASFRRDLPAGVPLLPDHLRKAWFAAVDAAQAAGELFVTFTGWVAVGRKPGTARR